LNFSNLRVEVKESGGIRLEENFSHFSLTHGKNYFARQGNEFSVLAKVISIKAHIFQYFCIHPKVSGQ